MKVLACLLACRLPASRDSDSERASDGCKRKSEGKKVRMRKRVQACESCLSRLCLCVCLSAWKQKQILYEGRERGSRRWRASERKIRMLLMDP